MWLVPVLLLVTTALHAPFTQAATTYNLALLKETLEVIGGDIFVGVTNLINGGDDKKDGEGNKFNGVPLFELAAEQLGIKTGQTDDNNELPDVNDQEDQPDVSPNDGTPSEPNESNSQDEDQTEKTREENSLGENNKLYPDGQAETTKEENLTEEKESSDTAQQDSANDRTLLNKAEGSHDSEDEKSQTLSTTGQEVKQQENTYTHNDFPEDSETKKVLPTVKPTPKEERIMQESNLKIKGKEKGYLLKKSQQIMEPTENKENDNRNVNEVVSDTSPNSENEAPTEKNDIDKEKEEEEEEEEGYEENPENDDVKGLTTALYNIATKALE